VPRPFFPAIATRSSPASRLRHANAQPCFNPAAKPGRLAGSMARDFNNFLTTIIGFADVVEHRLGAENPVNSEVREIKRAGDGAASYAPHGSAVFVAFSVVCLLFALYHSITFLSLAGVIIHVKLLDRPVPSRLIVLSQFGLWAVASIVIAAVLIGFAR